MQSADTDLHRDCICPSPRLVRLGGTATELNCKPLTGVAGITFTLNHLRISELPGVYSDIDATDVAAQSVTLVGTGGAQAAVTVNAKTHAVTAKNVKLSGNNVACVSPD